jgi:hypothetical protein
MPFLIHVKHGYDRPSIMKRLALLSLENFKVQEIGELDLP